MSWVNHCFDLACRLGWLNLVDREAKTDEAVYAFFHPTFQEYFAACAIDDWRYFLNHDNENPNPLLNPNPSLEYDDGKPGYRIFEPQWKEVILLWLGREDVPPKQKQEFLMALVNFNDGCWELYRYQAWFLAAMGTAESREFREFREFKNFFFECDPNEAHEGAIEPNDTGYSLTELVVKFLVRWSCGYFNEEHQEWQRFATALEQPAKAALLETDRSLAVAALTEHYRSNLHLSIDPDWRIQWKVAELLGKIAPSNKKTHTTLKHFFLKSPNFTDRFSSLWTLEKIAPNYIEAHPILCEAPTQLFHQMAEQLRCEATTQWYHQMVERLTNSLLNARNNFERLGWDLSSINLDNSEQLAALIDFIRSFDDPLTRRLASKMLEQMNPKDPKNFSILINLCTSDNEFIRTIAASALGKNHPNYPKAMTIALDTLIELIRTSDDESIHQDAVESIRQILQNHQLEPTVSALKNSMQNLVTQNDARRYEAFYSIILYSAYNLPYRDFYQAWHQTTI
jgi:HEAT repeat protein